MSVDKDKLELYARVAAIESAVQLSLALSYGALKTTPAQVREIHSDLIRKLQERTFPTVDPAYSDLLASEVQAATEKLLNAVEELHQALQGTPRGSS